MSEKKVVRVLHINNNLNPGAGVAENIVNYYRIVNRQKYKFDFFLYDSKSDVYINEIEKNGNKVYKASGNIFCIISQYIEILKNNNYDIIELHAPIYSYIYLKYAKRYGVKNIICHCHSVVRSTSKVKNFLTAFLNLNIKKDANYFWASSKVAGQYWFGSKIVKDSPNFKVIPNYIFCEQDQNYNNIRNKLRKDLNISDDEILLGFVGRLSKEKNLLFLLDVYEKLKNKNQKYKLLFIGDGNFKDKLEKVIEQKEMKDIIFVGYQKNVSNWLHSLDLFLFPSLKEGLGMSLVEAQLCKVPCIAMDSIPDETNVGLVEYLPDDCDIWVTKIEKYDIKKDKEINTELYNPIKNIKKITGYYDEMISQK